MTAKISLEEMQKRISEKWNYISIIPETFISSKKVCSFLDLDFGIFTSTPQNLLTGRSLPGHRDRFREQIQENGSRAGRKAAEKRKETNVCSVVEIRFGINNLELVTEVELAPPLIDTKDTPSKRFRSLVESTYISPRTGLEGGEASG